MLHDERLEGFAHAPPRSAPSASARHSGRSSNRRFSGRTPDRASASRRTLRQPPRRGLVLRAHNHQRLERLFEIVAEIILRTQPRHLAPQPRAVAAETAESGAEQLQQPDVPPLGARGAHVRASRVSRSRSPYVAPLSTAVVWRRTEPRTTFSPGPFCETRKRNHANRSARSRGSLSPPPFFFFEPAFVSDSSTSSPSGTSSDEHGGRDREQRRAHLGGSSKAASSATGAPARWPSNAARSTPSADITFKVSSAGAFRAVHAGGTTRACRRRGEGAMSGRTAGGLWRSCARSPPPRRAEAGAGTNTSSRSRRACTPGRRRFRSRPPAPRRRRAEGSLCSARRWARRPSRR